MYSRVMRTVVFEMKTVGHCVGFAAGYAATFAGHGDETILAVAADVPDSPKAESLPAGVAIHPIHAKSVDYRGAEQGGIERRVLAEVIAELRPERVVVPTADALGDAIANDPTPIPGLDSLDWREVTFVLHAVEAAAWPGGRSRINLWKKGLRTIKRLGRCGRLLSCDPYATIGPGAWPIRMGLCPPPCFIAHPLPPVCELDRPAARALLDWPDAQRLVVALGDIAPRRGIEPLIRSVARNDWPDDTTLVLAGICTDAARAALDSLDTEARRRVLVLDRYLIAEEYAAAYRAADAIWAGSPHHIGISATQWQAALADRPSVVLDTHRCGTWLSGRIGPGAIARAEPDSIAIAIAKALQSPPQSHAQATYLKRFIDTKQYESVLFHRKT